MHTLNFWESLRYDRGSFVCTSRTPAKPMLKLASFPIDLDDSTATGMNAHDWHRSEYKTSLPEAARSATRPAPLDAIEMLVRVKV